MRVCVSSVIFAQKLLIMIRILLVEDHKIVRDGLKALLETAAGIKVVAECEDGGEVLPIISKVKVDVILMDIQLKRTNGIEATRMVMEKNQGMKILALSMYNESAVVARAVKAGAKGFVVKNTDKDELVKAIRLVHKRKNYFSKEIPLGTIQNASSLMHSEDVMGINGSFSLTKREKSVLRLIGKGMTNIQIGDELNISKRTAECHRHRLIKKVGAKNSVGLIKFASDNALID